MKQETLIEKRKKELKSLLTHSNWNKNLASAQVI